MKQATISLLCICVAVGAPYSFADEHTKGYILKVGEGEFAAGAIIKASPKTGTNGAVLLYEPFPENFSTGLHYHAEADEFFYVISGTGFARFGGKDHPIEPGDVIFIPAGEDHKLFTEGTTVELLAFLDKPGLDEEFRAWHRAYGEDMPVTIEQLNEIARKHGTVYKTLEGFGCFWPRAVVEDSGTPSLRLLLYSRRPLCQLLHRSRDDAPAVRLRSAAAKSGGPSDLIS